MEGEEEKSETAPRGKKRKAHFLTPAESTVPKRAKQEHQVNHNIRVQHPSETATPTSTRGSADLGRTEEGDSEDPPPAPEQVTDEDPPATAQGSEDT